MEETVAREGQLHSPDTHRWLERRPTLRDKVEPSVKMIDLCWVPVSRPWHLRDKMTLAHVVVIARESLQRHQCFPSLAFDLRCTSPPLALHLQTQLCTQISRGTSGTDGRGIGGDGRDDDG